MVAKNSVKTGGKKPVSGSKNKVTPKPAPNSTAKQNKPPVKKISPVKSGIKNAKPKVTIANAPIKKQAPVKKTATPAVKKAVPKKLNHPKKKEVILSKKIPAPIVNSKTAPAKSAAKANAAPVKKETAKAPVKEIPKATGTKVLAKAKEINIPAPKPLVLPKITSTRSRKYEPEFTKSVLDQPLGEKKGPTMRYSDQELVEFRELIQRKLETAKKELGYLQGLITRKDEMGGDDTDNRYMTMEDGSLSMEREQLSQMASRQITFIDHLEKAMMRIENKTYGICRITGKLIDKARLRAVPHATLSIEAKMGIVK